MSIIVVAGAVANKPFNGGEAWVRLSWAEGLRRLGFDVYLIEEIDCSTCIDVSGSPAEPTASVNRAYFDAVTAQLPPGRSALLTSDGGAVSGITPADAEGIAGEAVLLVNISGNLRYRPLVDRFRRTAYVDLDPGYTQCWHRKGEAPGLAEHDVHFTIAECIGEPGCSIPGDGIRWRRTRQPVVLDDWPVESRANRGFTTVASWRGGAGRLEHRGRLYGQKAHEWRAVADLPRRCDARFEAALSIDPADAADRDLLVDCGWKLVEPLAVAFDPEAFRRYVQDSAAEFSVAQGLYVEMGTGWFSDRTVRYLAAGKPALVQDTGFSRHVPVGDGLLAFEDLEGAVAGARSLVQDYERHSRAARSLATAFFDSAAVLTRFLDDAGADA